MSSDFNENSSLVECEKEDVKEIKKAKDDDDAVILVIQREDVASNENCDTQRISTSSSIDQPAVTGSNSPYMASPGSGGEEEEIYKTVKTSRSMGNLPKKLKFWVWIAWIAFVCITTMLISSLTVDKLERIKILELHIWKWCVLLLVIVCGQPITGWFMNVLIFIFERNFMLKKKFLYFVHGLKKSVQFCLWLVLVLLSWVLLFNGSRINKRSESTIKVLNFVTRALVSFLIAAVIWLIKTTLIMILAASVNVRSFFDRIQESLFHQYLLHKLSGSPSMELGEEIGYNTFLSFRSTVKKTKEVIDMDKMELMKQEKVSSWTIKSLCNVICTTKLSTLEEIDDKKWERIDLEITSEEEAKAAGYRIFSNVTKSGCEFIDMDDLLRFLSKQEVYDVLPLFEGAVETGKIDKSMLTDWVLKAYLGRKSLALAIKDAQMAVKQLNKVVSILVLVISVIVWLISMGLATTEVLLFLASQIVIFGNTTKAVFEGIIFVFLTHPFDIGDHCVIDGVQMIVEEINIMRTGFLKYDNQKIYYPNAVLATKTIGNMHTSSSSTSPFIGDAVEFLVDASTTVENIQALKACIKMYIESKPQHWNPNHNVVVLEIESKMKMALYVTHIMNHQNNGEKINRRSDLVLELKKIFEELSIKYHILPQEVPVSFAGSATTGPASTG